MHGALGLEGPAGLISVQQVSGQQMRDEGLEGLSAEREDKAERDLLQRVEGLPCAKQETLSPWPRGTNLDPGMAIPGQRVQDWRICCSPKSRPLLPGTLRSHTSGCQPHCPGVLRAGRDLGGGFPHPHLTEDGSEALRGRDLTEFRGGRAGSSPQAMVPSWERAASCLLAPPTLGICFSPPPTPLGGRSHPPTADTEQCLCLCPTLASPLTSLGFSFPRCTAVLIPRVTGGKGS